MFFRFLLFSGVFVLGACAYLVDDQLQDLRVVTPGAYNASCSAYINNVRYRFRPPQTIRVKKSKGDLVLDCMAPGNRRKKLVITPVIEKSAYGNVITGVLPGAAWDYVSEAMFAYPDIVEVNFTHTPIRAEDLPAQNRPDIKQPEDYDLEEFRPGLPHLNADRNAPAVEIKRRERAMRPTGPYIAETVSTSDALDGKSDPMPVVQTYGDDINPAGAPTPPAAQAPIPLYPGE